MKLLFFFLIALLLSGCNLFESKADKNLKIAQQKAAFEKKIQESKEVQLKRIDAQTQRELAKIQTQKALAKIEKEKMLDKIRFDAQLKKQKLELEQKKAQILLNAKIAEQEHADSMEIKRYLLLILFFMLLIISFFTYYYFKKRHEDKLRSYQDNLDKYFHQQENMTKMRIAEKIIDTVASGKLDKEQERELIRALNAPSQPQQPESVALIEEK